MSKEKDRFKDYDEVIKVIERDFRDALDEVMERFEDNKGIRGKLREIANEYLDEAWGEEGTKTEEEDMVTVLLVNEIFDKTIAFAGFCQSQEYYDKVARRKELEKIGEGSEDNEINNEINKEIENE